MVKWEKYVLTPAERARKRHPERYRRNVVYEGLQGLTDTAWQLLKHPSSMHDAYGLSQALRNKATGRDERPNLRGSDHAVPASQATTADISQTQTMGPKRLRSGSVSTITSKSGTGYGSLANSESMIGAKIKDKARRAVGYWKYKPISTSNIINAMFPKYMLRERWIPTTDYFNSLGGKQSVFDALAQAAATAIFPMLYLQSIYNKLVRELNAFTWSSSGQALVVGGAPYSTNHSTTLLPDLHVSNFKRVYTFQNSSTAPQTITILEFLCKQDTLLPPSTCWTQDIDNEFVQIVGSTSFVGSHAPTTDQVKSITDPGRRPSGKGDVMKQFWTQTRATQYDVPPGGIIRHTILHGFGCFPVSSIFPNSKISAYGELTTRYIKGISRAVTFIAQGAPAWEGADKAVGAQDNRILTAPSYWNVNCESCATFRVPTRQKAFSSQQTIVNDDGITWSTVATDFGTSFGSTAASYQYIDQETHVPTIMEEEDT